MSWLSRISVGAKLALIAATALLALVLVTGGGLLALRHAGTVTLGVMDQELAAVKQLGQARASVGNMRRYEKDMFLNIGDEAAVGGYLKKWRAEVVAGEKLMRNSRQLVPADDQRRIDTLLAGLASYAKGLESINQRLETGQVNHPAAANKAMEPLKTDIRAMDKALDEVVAAVDQRVEQRRAAVVAENQRSQRAGLVALVLTTLALGGLCFSIGRSITQPLRTAMAALSRLTEGDLTQPIAGRGSDELAQMMRNLAGMQVALRDVVAGIQDSARGVAAASAQIAQGNGDLSQRTEEQASSLQQTAASMEQLTGTVRHSADTAQQATVLAQGASASAARGGEVVAQVVTTMGEIQAASRRIGEITGVIDGIAFQTNILALNAAVEAARAGEQGRGFAVVAAEVRTLAQRSAEAARQIKSLIGDSTAKVESGGQLVDDAGKAMSGVVCDVKRVCDLISELAAASTEQRQGIEQVGQAVNMLDHTTQQNAALVEQSAAAAESLKAQAVRLTQTVAAFRVEAAAA